MVLKNNHDRNALYDSSNDKKGGGVIGDIVELGTILIVRGV